MARPDVQIKAGIEKRLARTRGVRAAVRDVGRAVLDHAKAGAAEHRDSGDYAESLTLERGDVDVHVVAHDPAAVLIEHGYTTEDGRRVEGQKILTRAAHAVIRSLAHFFLHLCKFRIDFFPQE